MRDGSHSTNIDPLFCGGRKNSRISELGLDCLLHAWSDADLRRFTGMYQHARNQ